MNLVPRPDLLATMKGRFPDHLQLDEILTANVQDGEIFLGYVSGKEYSAFLSKEEANKHELYFDAEIVAVQQLNRFAVADIVATN